MTKEIDPKVLALAHEMTIILASSLAQATFDERKQALESALKKDWAPLGYYFRQGGRTTPEIRAFLIDVMDGKLQQPRRKTSPWRNENRNKKIALRILTLRANKEKRAIEKVADQFGLEQQQARRAFKRHQAEAAKILETEKRLGSQVKNLVHLVRRPGRRTGKYLPAFSTPEHFCVYSDIKP